MSTTEYIFNWVYCSRATVRAEVIENSLAHLQNSSVLWYQTVLVSIITRSRTLLLELSVWYRHIIPPLLHYLSLIRVICYYLEIKAVDIPRNWCTKFKNTFYWMLLSKIVFCSLLLLFSFSLVMTERAEKHGEIRELKWENVSPDIPAIY